MPDFIITYRGCVMADISDARIVLIRQEKEGIGLAAVEQQIEYKRELRAGDVLTICSSIFEIRPKSIRILHEMRNDVTGEVAAITIVTGVCIDWRTRKATPLPSDISDRMPAIVMERAC